jgi:hypothetical protein
MGVKAILGTFEKPYCLLAILLSIFQNAYIISIVLHIKIPESREGEKQNGESSPS